MVPLLWRAALLFPVVSLAWAQANARGQISEGASLSNAGVQLRLAGQPAEAIVKFNAAIKIAEADSDDRLLATALSGLGASLIDQGELARAQPVLRRSLALFEKSTGANSLETAEAANNLAMIYRRNGDLAHAEEALERALPVLERHFASASHEMEIAYNNMFILLAEQKRWDEAEPYLHRALHAAYLLPENADRADVEENLALLEAHRGEFTEAVETMRRVIATEERMLGNQAPRLASSLASYATYLRKISQKSEAQRAEQRARVIEGLADKNLARP